MSLSNLHSGRVHCKNIGMKEGLGNVDLDTVQLHQDVSNIRETAYVI